MNPLASAPGKKLKENAYVNWWFYAETLNEGFMVFTTIEDALKFRMSVKARFRVRPTAVLRAAVHGPFFKFDFSIHWLKL